MNLCIAAFIAMCGGLSLAATPARAEPRSSTFTTLPRLHNGYSAFVQGVSGDGQVPIGRARSPAGSEAVRWVNGVPQSLWTGNGELTGARGASRNGSTVVGSQEISNGAYWVPTQYQDGQVTHFTDYLNGIAMSVSANGSVAVGRGEGGAFRADQNGVRVLASGQGSIASGVSDDGNTVAVTSSSDASSISVARAGRWRNGALTTLPLPTGFSYRTEAGDISPNGNVIVGYGMSGDGVKRACAWLGTSSVVNLGALDITGTPTSEALAVSSSGTVIVGRSGRTNSTVGNITDATAFLWTEETGMVDLKTFLQNDGIDLTGWTLETALGISDDGSVIVGRGRYGDSGGTVSWVVTIPSPATSVIFSTAIAGCLRRPRRR